MLAYWLSWANPNLKEVNPENHKLARAFLDIILKSDSIRLYADRITEEDLKELKVKTQFKHIDVAVDIGQKVFIIIEDKVNSREHSNQLERYLKLILDQESECGHRWTKEKVVVVYLKTGNESKKHYPDFEGAVIISRKDLLDLMKDRISHADDIFQQYHRHLEIQKEQTESFEKFAVKDWTWPAVQGFFMKLENQLLDKQKMGEHDGWTYVANPAGGFLCFHWYERKIPDLNCHIYLQLDGKDRLQVRVSGAWNENGTGIKSSANHRHSLLNLLTEKAQGIPSLKVEKSGRYKPGMTGGIAELLREDGGSYIARGSEGKLDFENTIKFIENAMELVDRAQS